MVVCYSLDLVEWRSRRRSVWRMMFSDGTTAEATVIGPTFLPAARAKALEALSPIYIAALG